MILIAPDKFKGTYTAQQICNLVADRLRREGFTSPLRLSPLSDGGEGAPKAFLPGAKTLRKGVYEREGRQLVVSSEIVGFEAFKSTSLPLMKRSSIELGKAVSRGVATMIAIGGTAVSDGGAGFLQGLGVKFYNSQGSVIEEPLTPSTLTTIAEVDKSALSEYDISGIVDVRASLTDGNLTTLDFARQKALPGEDISGLKDALTHLQRVVGGVSEWDGAGGGLGYAVASVIGAKCVSGAEAAIDGLDIDWSKVELVITGEGSVDEQTVKGGKLVDAIYRKAKSHGIPTLILYGKRTEGLPYEHMAQLLSNWEELAKTTNE